MFNKICSEKNVAPFSFLTSNLILALKISLFWHSTTLQEGIFEVWENIDILPDMRSICSFPLQSNSEHEIIRLLLECALPQLPLVLAMRERKHSHNSCGTSAWKGYLIDQIKLLLAVFLTAGFFISS